MKRLAFAALAACGRFGFESHPAIDAIDSPSIDAPSCGVQQITAGRFFTCEIDKAGGVWCWGANDDGQVFPGGPNPVPSAHQLALPGPATQISSGREFSCARLASGDVWCWGSSSNGQLGGAAGSGPVQVPLGGETALEVHVGAHQACIRRASDLAIECWGGNESFALGNTGASVQAPTVVAGTAGATMLAVGHHGSCYVDGSGTVRCWGADTAGELGMFGTAMATPIVIGGIPASSRAARTGQEGCAIDTAGDLRCWGQGATGQLGDGAFVTHAVPTAVIASNVVDAQLVPFGGWAVHGDGTLSGWGQIAIDGQLVDRDTPQVSTLTGVTQLAAGYQHTCALVNTSPYCWGSNNSGELGRGFAGFAAVPVTVPIGATEKITIVDRTVCARASSGHGYCWGLGSNEQLGNGSTASSMSPLDVTTGLSVIDGIAAGWSHSCAWGGGAISCWGADNAGQLGDGTMTTGDVTGRSPAVEPITNVTTAVVGYDHTCAVISGGAVECWGGNYLGQLGDGTNNPSLTPVTVTGVTSPVVLATKYQTTCAIAGGTVYCWCWNGSGQIGDGTTTDRSTPTAVALPAVPTDVRPAENHTCALVTGGDVYCWGSNIAGELGLGDNTERHAPAKLTLPAPAELLVTGYFGACARITGGDVYCWGTFGFGASTSPTKIPQLQNASALAIENGSGCAVISGALACWGNQLVLGSGDPTPWMPMLATTGCMP